MIADLDAVDPTFVADLLASQTSVRLVEAWLRERGFSVHPQRVRVRPDVRDRMAYSDAGDIVYEERLEVKHRQNIDFTCAQDYPYRDGVFVDVCHSWDRAHPKPIAYVICNRKLSHAAIVRRDSAKSWRRVRKVDKGRAREFYVAPLECVTFIALEGVAS